MKTKLPLFIIWLSVSASCASVSPVPEGSRTEMPTQENASDGIPYPVPTLQDRLDYLEGKIVRLSNEVEMLNGRLVEGGGRRRRRQHRATQYVPVAAKQGAYGEL